MYYYRFLPFTSCFVNFSFNLNFTIHPSLTLLVVPGPPAAIRALPAGPHSIVVSWLPPERPNGILEHYTLYYRPLNAHRVCTAGEGGERTCREEKGEGEGERQRQK